MNTRALYTHLHDPDDRRLCAYRSLKGKALERDGIFIAEGEKVVRSLAASSCPILSCLASRDAIARYRPLLATLRKKGAAVYLAPADVIEKIIGFRFHRGIMAVGQCPVKHTMAETLAPSRRRQLFVALNTVNDPQNVGLIARTAAGFGARALIVDQASYDPYYRKAVRVSMGTIFKLPVYYEADLAASLAWLKKERGVRIVAATPDRAGTAIARADLSGALCVVVGNEDTGVSRRVAKIADCKVRIPMARGIDSFNVAAACAIILYEASRQRH